MSDRAKKDARTDPEAKARDSVEPSDQKPQGKLKAFHGNTYDDYYDSAMEDYPLPAKLLMDACVRILWVVTRLLYPWRFDGVEHLTDDPRGKVIVMNHESMLDPVALITTLWLRGVKVRTVYKSEFDKIGIATWFFSRVGGFPVSRGQADMKTIRRAKAMLQRGECVLVYPEGTRVKDDAEAENHAGFAIMAQLAKAPVAPVAIVGARHLGFRTRVFIRAGAVVEWDEVTATKRKARVTEMGELGMARVYALREELRAEHPGIE